MKYLLIGICLLIPTLTAAQTPTATPTYEELKARMERFEGRLKDWPGLGRYAELATSEPESRKGELFIIGTFASLLWAGLWAGAAYWGVRAW